MEADVYQISGMLRSHHARRTGKPMPQSIRATTAARAAVFAPIAGGGRAELVAQRLTVPVMRPRVAWAAALVMIRAGTMVWGSRVGPAEPTKTSRNQCGSSFIP